MGPYTMAAIIALIVYIIINYQKTHKKESNKAKGKITEIYNKVKQKWSTKHQDK